MNLTKILLGAVAVSAIATSAFAQASDSDSAAVGITVLQPITVSKKADLQFGRVIRGAGTVTVSAAGTRTVGAGLSAPPTTGTISRAQFEVKAEGGQALTWTIPSTVTLDGPASSTLTVNTLSTTPTTAGTLGAEQVYTLNVGGEITLAADTTTGAYAGTMEVTVAYQ